MRPLSPILSLLIFLAAPVAGAHFLVLTPLSDAVVAGSNPAISLDIAFTHPMAGGPVMEMDTPVQFGVVAGGTKADLRASLTERKLSGKRAYRAAFTVEQPGAHVFHIESAPYYDPSERTTIIQYAKVVVEAFGSDEGWDALVGFPVEVKPLVRPYGLWTGNVFQGVVLKDGRPVPSVDVEVEYLNEDAKVKVPSSSFETQIIRTDATGTFTYGLPRAGWWGFAALIAGEKQLAPDGKESELELGALIWVHARDME